jgi:hypothetical protein
MERFDLAESVDRRAERRAEIDELDAGTLATAWFDIDATVSAYCRDYTLPIPTDVDALVDLHLKAIGAWPDTLDAGLEASPRTRPMRVSRTRRQWRQALTC